MSYFKGFGTTSNNSNGNFWFQRNSFPGFLYKKSRGGGARRNPSYGLICNKPTFLWNKYKPGSGVGGVNTSVRRAKLYRATACENHQCGNFITHLGVYN